MVETVNALAGDATMSVATSDPRASIWLAADETTRIVDSTRDLSICSAPLWQQNTHTQGSCRMRSLLCCRDLVRGVRLDDSTLLLGRTSCARARKDCADTFWAPGPGVGRAAQSRLARIPGNQRSTGDGSHRIVSSRTAPVEMSPSGTPISSSRRS